MQRLTEKKNILITPYQRPNIICRRSLCILNDKYLPTLKTKAGRFLPQHKHTLNNILAEIIGGGVLDLHWLGSRSKQRLFSTNLNQEFIANNPC